MKEKHKRSKKIKHDQLGMNPATARHQLVRSILLHYARKCGEDKCYRCGLPIEAPNDLSIDHKIPWLHNSKELFFDINNIAWSHKKCNKTDRVGRKECKDGYAWCHVCKKELKLSEFHKEIAHWNGVMTRCKECSSKKAKEYQPRRKRKKGQ